MEGIGFIRRNHIFYLRKKLAEKLHKTVHTETEGYRLISVILTQKQK